LPYLRTDELNFIFCNVIERFNLSFKFGRELKLEKSIDPFPKMSAVHYAFQIHELVSLGIEEIIFVVVEQAIHSRGALHIIDIVSEIIDLETGIASMGFSIRC